MKTEKDQTYRTVTGRAVDLAHLTAPERHCLAAVVEKYRAGLEWTRFASSWMKEVAKHSLDRTSPIYRICQDLEARLGIAQGKAAPPDYRDYLAALIEEQYGTRYKFCKETEIDESQLSRIFAGKGDFSMETLKRALAALHASLVVQSEESLKANASPEEASRALEAAAR